MEATEIASPEDPGSRVEKDLPVAIRQSRKLDVKVVLVLPSLTYQPIAGALVQVWVAVEGVEEQSLFAESQADRFGLAVMEVPAEGSFLLKGVAADSNGVEGGLVGTRSINEALAADLYDLFPEGVPLNLYADEATIEVTVNFVGDHVPTGVWVSVLDTFPQDKALLNWTQSRKFFRPSDEEGVVTFSVVPGSPYYCVARDQNGNLLLYEFSGSPLGPGASWECELTIRTDEWWRQAYFQLELAWTPEGPGRFTARLLEPETGVLFRTQSNNFSEEGLYSILVPRGKVVRLELSSLAMGQISTLIRDDDGAEPSTPIKLRVPQPSSIRYSASNFPDLAKPGVRALLTFPYPRSLGVPIRPVPELDGIYELSFMVSGDVVGIRVGDRLFSCTLEWGVPYFLSDPQFQEIEIPRIVDVEFLGETDSLRNSQHVFAFSFAGVAWSTQFDLQNQADRIVTHARLPVGRNHVMWTHGSSIVRHEFEVPGPGTKITLH
jgi:hypothetical protein